ncbi:MAG: LysE family translocator [Rhodospirillales bacterium]|nr:LysE family translocator [Rhodospirillales bacterium]
MPIDPNTLAAFSVTVLAIVISPGPDTMLIIRYGLTSGHRAAFAAVAGVQMGLVVHTLMAVAGLSVLIATSPVLFRTVAVVGAGYLAWLGLQGLRGPGAFSIDNTKEAVPAGKACRDAILTNVLNPKVIILFLALFPNFVAMERDDVSAQLWTLSATLILINVAWQAPLAWLAKEARRWLTRPRTQRVVSTVTGAILLAFAALMLYEHLL